jgi:geranylgeranyl transferase type-2 subunit beta
MLGYPGLEEVDPLYCMPASVISRMGLKKPYQVLSKKGK